MQGFLITEHEVKEVRDLAHHDEDLYEEILMGMYELGVWPEADAREPWFLCEAHTDELIDETLNRFEDAVKMTVG
jgi:glutamate-1-semialdehyde 2,1-aminomutase